MLQRPKLKIQIDLPQNNSHFYFQQNSQQDMDTTKDILREKIKPSELLNMSLEIADEIKNMSEQLDIQMDNVDFIQNNIIMQNLKPKVVHTRQFDTGTNMRLFYKSYIYYISDVIIKLINYNCNPLSDYVIIKEIAAQKYAQLLSVDKCNFETPNIMKIGSFPVSKLPKLSQDIFDCNG